MASLTFNYSDRGFDVMIVGYEIGGGWRLAVELKKGKRVELLRDTANVYPDFASLRSMGIWTAQLKITALEQSESSSALDPGVSDQHPKPIAKSGQPA